MPVPTAALINMSYADLIIVCDVIQAFMVRDTTEFAGYGIDSVAISAYLTKINAFRDLPTDNELTAFLINATDLKNSIAKEVRVMLRSFSERARIAFANNKGNYGLFHANDLSKLPDSDLHLFGREVKRTADLYHTELAAGGLTALMITNLGAKLDDFEEALTDQKKAIANRDIATTNRADKALELYTLLMSYCETGKVIWYEVNEAKYNDYIIFSGSSGGVLTAPINFAFDFPSATFSWDAVTNATSYQAEMSNNGADWTEIYADIAEGFTYVPVTGAAKYYRVRARNSTGFGPYSTELTFTYYDSLAKPENLTLGLTGGTPPFTIHLNWNAVTGADKYEVYHCTVPIGNPAGPYTFSQLVTSNAYTEDTNAGFRHYFYVIAKNSYLHSEQSSPIFMDL